MTRPAQPSPLDRAKERFTVIDIAGIVFPGWRPARCCRSPFRDDRHSSFSIYDDGRKWKDHATGDGGDVIDFLVKARGCSKSDAARELIAMAGTGEALPATRPNKSPVAAREIAKANLLPMPTACREVWDEGLAHLRANANLQDVLDKWRAWPVGTVRTLAENGLIGCPTVSGKRGIAFPVQAPFLDDLEIVSTREIGFHVRHKPADPQTRAAWEYFPSEKKHGASCPALPFVLGAGFVPFARTIVVSEGQFDAITLAAAAGWLASDAAWPERIAVFATRGATAWRPLIDTWGRFWLPDARFVVFQDADKPGDSWRAPGGLIETLCRMGHRVSVGRSVESGAKDLNDLHRLHPITPETVAKWLTATGGDQR